MLPFDPLDAVALRQAFQRTAPDQRADFLAETLVQMRDTLEGAPGVALLQDEDAPALLAGLASALRTDPTNLTAGRVQGWHLRRSGDHIAAERQLQTTLRAWPKVDGLVLELLRLLTVTRSSRRFAFLEEHQERLVGTGQIAAYCAQTFMGRMDRQGRDIRAEALADLMETTTTELMAHAIAPSPEIDPANQTLLWSISEMLSSASSIALVGNGPNVQGRKQGAAIDAHDVVVRCNWPLVDAFAEDVGARTDLMVFNEGMRNVWLPRHRSRSKGYGELLALGIHPSPVGFPPVDHSASEHALAAVLPPPLRALISDVCYDRATTGLIAINLFVLLFARPITLYGFDFFEQDGRSHYYDTQARAYLGHELEYERWYVTQFLTGCLPDRVRIG